MWHTSAIPVWLICLTAVLGSCSRRDTSSRSSSAPVASQPAAADASAQPLSQLNAPKIIKSGGRRFLVVPLSGNQFLSAPEPILFQIPEIIGSGTVHTAPTGAFPYYDRWFLDGMPGPHEPWRFEFRGRLAPAFDAKTR